MLAANSAPRVPPIAPTPLPPPSPSSVPPSVDPWGPPAANAPLALPLKSPIGASNTDAALLAVSVRLRVEDPDGRSCGSGTIIDSRGDEALVLTCGHIFRDSQGKGRITVDLFGSGEPQQVAGRLISFDLSRDVGLVAIRTSGPVAVAHLAPPNYRIKQGMAVASAGCNQGDPPTVRRSQVNAFGGAQESPSLWVAGQPVEGRSGGGLFSSEGYVIGVCNAADPSNKEGLFAAPVSIYAELDRDKLAFVYQSPSENSAGTPAMPGPLCGAASDVTDLTSSGAPPPAPGPVVVPATAIEPIGNLPPHEQAALEELRRRAKEGAEVICIVRPRNNPEGKSDVIVLEHASQEFVRQLAADGRRQDQPFHTSLELPNPRKALPGPRKVLLEWSLPPGAPAPNPTSAHAS